jgi:hypothetical protein
MTASEKENVFAQEEQHSDHDHSENDDPDSVTEKEDAQVKTTATRRSHSNASFPAT